MNKKELEAVAKFEKSHGKKEIIELALDIICTEDFDLAFEHDTNNFKLIDLQGVNLGNIESDRFDNLAGVIDRLEIYHNDYFFSEEDSNYLNEIWCFFNSDKTFNVLEEIKNIESLEA